jgi:hypothetical protein
MDLSYLTDISFFKSEAFRLLVPLASAALGVWIKSEMRHPEKQTFKKEDFAVGIQLIQTACLSFLTLMTQKAVQLHSMLATQSAIADTSGADKLSSFLAFSSVRLASMLIFLFGMTSLVRRKGWKNKDEMKVTAGIAIPIAAGILCLYTVIREAQ